MNAIDKDLMDDGFELNLNGKQSAENLHDKELEMERQLKIKRDQAKRKNEFRDKITDLVEDDNDRENLIEGFDNKMKSLDNLLKTEMDK